MLSEEEKQAIKTFKSYINAIDTFGTIDYKCINNLYEPVKIVLNFMTKLQKEIKLAKEQLKKQCEIADERNDLLVKVIELQKENKSKEKAYNDCYCEYKHYKQYESIPKQVVKDKIKEIEKDIENTKNKLNNEYCNYIRKARLKAFITKMNEFRKYLKELLGDE